MNLKYIMLIIILGALIGGGILTWRYWWRPKERMKTPEVEVIELPEGAFVKKGYDIYEKSKVAGYVEEGELHYKGEYLKPGFHEVEDYCYFDYSEKSSSKGNHLKEYFVVSGQFDSQKIHNRLSFLDRRCNCIDGACIKPSSVKKCTDTDEGRDIFSKGKVIGIRKREDFVSEFEDYCSGDGSNVLEGFCTTGISYDYERIYCEFGCDDGMCRKTFKFLPSDLPRSKCYDSDGGKNYSIKGETYGDYVGDVYDDFFVTQRDHCISEDYLSEGYCLDETHSTAEGIQCRCSDGICVK